MKTFAVGIDIGGTKVAIGLVDNAGNVHTKIRIPTDLTIHPNQMIARIVDEIQRIIVELQLNFDQLQGVGIGAPGPLDVTQGIIVCPPNLPNWSDIPIVDQFKSYLSVPIRLENDANAAALAEKWVGAAKENKNFIYMTLSTGIGVGIYMNDQLISGASGNAGDIGHIVIDPSQGICKCGQKGCFEYVASGTAIARNGSQLFGEELNTQEIFRLYQDGHPTAAALIDEVFTYIGIGCVTLINSFDPEKIVIGGGVSEVGEPLFQAIQTYVGRYALNPKGRITRIVPAALKQDIGIIGAASLILHHLADRKGDLK